MKNQHKTGKQLSLFNDNQVRRSFLCRFAFNPKRDLIKRLQFENLFGVRMILGSEDEAISHISANRHFINRHKPFVKEGKKYYYD